MTLGISGGGSLVSDGGGAGRRRLRGVIDRVDDFICRKSTFESC